MTWWPLEGIAAHRVTNNTLLPYRVVEAAGLHKAIVWFGWNAKAESWTLPPPPPKPDLSDDVLFLRYREAWARTMWEKYKGTRTFYRLNTYPAKPLLEPWEYQLPKYELDRAARKVVEPAPPQKPAGPEKPLEPAVPEDKWGLPWK